MHLSLRSQPRSGRVTLLKSLVFGVSPPNPAMMLAAGAAVIGIAALGFDSASCRRIL
jgi:hypothetical protein